MNPVISAYCHIINNRVFLNGELVFEMAPGDDRAEFMKAAFRQTGTKYPKFFKMDEYSKLGFLAAEVLLKSVNQSDMMPESTGIVLSNSHATLTTDRQFQSSIQSDGAFFPSPAVFVYTLPNIMAGEMAIRHHFNGENAFFVSSSFDSAWHANYVNQLLLGQKISSCISGWVDLDEQNYEAFLAWVVVFDEKGLMAHTPEMLDDLYRTFENK